MTRAIRSNGASRFFAAVGAGLLLSACADTGESPGASVPSASEAAATSTAIASDTPDSTPSPTPEEPLDPSAYGSRATVVPDRLRVRSRPSLGADVTANLEGGAEVRPMEGPVISDGMRWYWVSYGSQIDMRYPGQESGWVAEVAVDASGNATGEPFLDIGQPVCPGSAIVDAQMMAGLSLYAVDVCDVQVNQLEGLIDTCIEGPYNPWIHEPGWLWFSCPYLRDDEPRLVDSQWFYTLAFPPNVKQPERGDVVTLHGQIGFEPDQYGDCVVETKETGPQAPDALAVEQQLWEQQCQLKFIVSDVEVRDRLDLPSPF